MEERRCWRAPAWPRTLGTWPSSCGFQNLVRTPVCARLGISNGALCMAETSPAARKQQTTHTRARTHTHTQSQWCCCCQHTSGHLHHPHCSVQVATHQNRDAAVTSRQGTPCSDFGWRIGVASCGWLGSGGIKHDGGSPYTGSRRAASVCVATGNTLLAQVLDKDALPRRIVITIKHTDVP